MKWRRVLKYILFLYILLMTAMLSAWSVWHIETGGKRIPPKTKNFILDFAKFPTDVFNNLKDIVDPSNDSRWVLNSADSNGFHYFTDTAQLASGYLLVSTFNQKNLNPIFELLNIREGKLLKTWEINIDTALKYTYTDFRNKYNSRLFHPMLLPDKSIIYHTENSLVKIDSNSKVVWAKNSLFAHSIEMENDTTLWIESRVIDSKLYWFDEATFLADDHISKVDPRTGNIFFTRSVAQILKDNGYDYIMYIGLFENDLLHINEIQPALFNSPYWEKGDLLISVRNRATVFLYRPSTNKIVWLKIGPWFDQHHCSFIDSSQIMVFGNDVLRIGQFRDTVVNGHNNAYVYDFKTDKVSTPFTGLFKGQQIKTHTEGRCNLLPNGDIFVDETNFGRVIIGDSSRPKLIYVDRIDDKHIKMLNWVRYLPTLPFKN